MFPQAPKTYTQERIGISAVARVAAMLGQIWRETPTGDVGVDGHLEFVDTQGYATGRTIGVQVKSGPSFFKHETEQAWLYYPEEKHRAYWEHYPLPVLLVLHDPNVDRSYWTDARQALRSPDSSGSASIAVPKANILQASSATQIFESAGVSSIPFISSLRRRAVRDVCATLGNASFPVTFFELFTHGLTNICRSLYFGMDLAITTAEANLELSGSEFGIAVGSPEHEFLFEYIRFLVAQHLANVDFADCLIDWKDREMQPHFVAPLTRRGRHLVRLIGEREANLVASGALAAEGNLHVAQEGFFRMDYSSYVARIPESAYSKS